MRLKSTKVLDFGQVVNRSATPFLVYIDVAEDVWFAEEREGRTRIQRWGRGMSRLPGF